MRQVAISTFIFFAGVFSNAAQSTTLEQWDTARLTKESNAVHIGEVTGSWSSWDPEKRMIYTYVKMRVDRTIKGKNRQEVLIRQPGGRANGIGMVVHGMASFKTHERTLVFLKNDTDGAPAVTGMAQGKYLLMKNKGDEEETAFYRAPSNVDFYTRGKGHAVGVAERRVPLHDLVDEIQAEVRSEGTQAR